MALAMTMAAGVLTGCGGKDPVVGNIIVEHPFHALRERMPRVYPDVPQSSSDRYTVLPERFPVGDAVDVPHEASGVESQIVVAFLEFVKFLDDGDRYHQVVVLKLADGLVVVQDDVRVKNKDFGLPAAPSAVRSVSVSCHMCY